MPMAKPTQAALDAYDAVFPDDERATRKQMFGMPAGFVNGNMFLGVFEDGVVLRVGAARRDDLAELEGIGPFEPMPGRPWREYVHARAARWSGTDELASWAVEALAHTGALPPKAPRKKKGR